MSKTRLVALIVDATRAYQRKIIPGVATYAREIGNWSLYVEEGPQDRLPDFRTWHGHGIITTFVERKVAEAVRRLKVPVVGIEGDAGWYPAGSGIPCFNTNNRAIGRLGTEHLLEQGFAHLAYCGVPNSRLTSWSRERAEAFAQRAEEAGRPCAVFTGHHVLARKWSDIQRSLTDWLAKLEKPLGVMAGQDARARHVLEACRTLNLRVPDEVGVLGVDNDEALCEATQPKLTSIEQGAYRLGYLAALELDRLMGGKKVAELVHYIEPEGVVKRQSTDVLLIEDPDVARAMRFIREHAHEGIRTLDLVEHVGLSRSTLEAKFKLAVGRPIHQEIYRLRLDRAKELVAHSDLSIKQIAQRAGFAHVQHMTNVFRKVLGETPGQYKQRVRH